MINLFNKKQYLCISTPITWSQADRWGCWPVWVKVRVAARDWIWRGDGPAAGFLLRVRQDVRLQIRRLRKLLVAALDKTTIKPISPLQYDKKSQPQRDRRKGDLQCECARAFSSWSRERIFFRSPQMCTGTVFLPCEPTGGASACCSRRKLFHIRRKHVPWGRDRSYLLRSMWCHHVVVLTIMSWWWWFDHIVNHFFLFQYLGPCVCRCFLMALLSRNICGVFLIITVIMMTLLAMKSIINSSKDWNWCLGKPSFIIFFGVTWWWFTLVHPLCGQAMVLLTSSCRSFFGFILTIKVMMTMTNKSQNIVFVIIITTCVIFLSILLCHESLIIIIMLLIIIIIVIIATQLQMCNCIIIAPLRVHF